MLNNAVFNTLTTKTHISAAIVHYREKLLSSSFFDLTRDQQESVICLLKKWETLSTHAHRTRQ